MWKYELFSPVMSGGKNPKVLGYALVTRGVLGGTDDAEEDLTIWENMTDAKALEIIKVSLGSNLTLGDAVYVNGRMWMFIADGVFSACTEKETAKIHREAHDISQQRRRNETRRFLRVKIRSVMERLETEGVNLGFGVMRIVAYQSILEEILAQDAMRLEE